VALQESRKVLMPLIKNRRSELGEASTEWLAERRLSVFGGTPEPERTFASGRRGLSLRPNAQSA
jgi:hypothetical protein